jgi:hypothetical protein
MTVVITLADHEVEWPKTWTLWAINKCEIPQLLNRKVHETVSPFPSYGDQNTAIVY